MASDVEVLRALGRYAGGMGIYVEGRRITPDLLDRAADALALLDAAEDAEAYTVSAEYGVWLARGNDAGESVPSAPLALSKHELAHRLIATALRLLEDDHA